MNLDVFKIILIIGVLGVLAGLGMNGSAGGRVFIGSLILLAACGGYYFFIGRKK